MSAQSPMISIPKKSTEDVDWTTPIRNLIAKSYGESPDNYASECQALQRCRQDAVKGAGSDTTARDLLYKYFGQLELLELRFSEIRVNFPWNDAFTNKQTTQTSIAYEKASVLFQIAATQSAIAAAQNRSSPEGLKLAFYYFRACAGMLTYINENFLHAPSTDLSRDVIKFLVGIIVAQATEVFLEKVIDEKKAHTLIFKIASQTAYLYTSLTEEVKDFMGKGIFDRNWVTLLQIKSKHFGSLAQYYRGLVDDKAGNHGEALVRFTLAESLAKEANRNATSFNALFVHGAPTLPADAGNALLDRTKAQLALCTERKNESTRENDLIYNAVLPSQEALPVIEKAAVATPISIQEVYGTPDVQKVIGPDIFLKLIPLSVHESASVYSEEKAKLVRSEVENAESADVEVRSALESMGVQEGLARFKAIAEGGIGAQEEIPLDVRRWREDIGVMEDREGVDTLMQELGKLKAGVKAKLDSISRDLDTESRDCEAMRVKYDHLWTQEPSASLTKSIRSDLKSHLTALEAASSSDQQVNALWDSVKGDIGLLLSDDLEDVFRSSAQGGPPADSLLDLDLSSDTSDERERAKIKQYTNEIEERLGRLKKIQYERNEVLKDLKEKIQADDVSHLLLLNRRNTGIEPTLFAAELEKFKPYQQRIGATSHHQQIALQEVESLWKSLRDIAGRGPGAKKWEEREKRKKDAVKRFSRARDGYMEVRDGLTKGLQFYHQLTDLSGTLSRNAKSFVNERRSERDKLVGEAEVQRRLSGGPQSPPPLADKPPVPPPRPQSNLESSFASMSLQGHRGPVSPPPRPPQSQYMGSPPPPPQSQSSRQSSDFHPPQQQPRSPYSPSAPAPDPYASLGAFGGGSQSPYAPSPAQNTSSSGSQYAQPQKQGSFPPPPPPPSQAQYHHQHNHSQSYAQPQQYSSPSQYAPPANSGFPPPPPPNRYSMPPPPQQQPSQGYPGMPPPPPQPSQGYNPGYYQGYGR
ncbi:BRO1-domain-containing protein [Coniophora puteana RWD-64-598 SS2]|uniref:BRO domain-containing protein 1 n=1 Tax=Coniophora puteana (strain RWD-64-598) TaxID=741705 RepID=A0A5M3MK83_CONPW|nr:BRO1-domain-containing protein [Coniophora puteana RWD-64-598 SS2]EIW79638.1 BRO1-domain-containing protein [Coniophora puteana RWD-64-598 SS2]